MLSTHPLTADGGGNCGRSGVYSELGVDVCQVGFDRGLGDEQPLAQLAVAQPFGEQAQQLRFPRSQDLIGVAQLLEQPGGTGGLITLLPRTAPRMAAKISSGAASFSR